MFSRQHQDTDTIVAAVADTTAENTHQALQEHKFGNDLTGEINSIDENPMR